jgi:hypothetical protein
VMKAILNAASVAYCGAISGCDLGPVSFTSYHNHRYVGVGHHLCHSTS